jgi:hypothetical protein
VLEAAKSALVALQTIGTLLTFGALQQKSLGDSNHTTSSAACINCQSLPSTSDLEYTNLLQAYKGLAVVVVFRAQPASCSLSVTKACLSRSFASAALDKTLGILLSPEWSVACFDRPGLLSPRTCLGGLAVLAAYPALIYWSGNPQHLSCSCRCTQE